LVWMEWYITFQPSVMKLLVQVFLP
jgi:hypothetical protein